MCFTYEGYSEFSSRTVSTSRKQRRCDWCRRTIRVGEQYVRDSWKYDGEFCSSATCRRCCYDTARIVVQELADGCKWHEAWPPDIESMYDWLCDHELERTAEYDVPGWFRLDEWPHKAIEKMQSVFPKRHVEAYRGEY